MQKGERKGGLEGRRGGYRGGKKEYRERGRMGEQRAPPSQIKQGYRVEARIWEYRYSCFPNIIFMDFIEFCIYR